MGTLFKQPNHFKGIIEMNNNLYIVDGSPGGNVGSFEYLPPFNLNMINNRHIS